LPPLRLKQRFLLLDASIMALVTKQTRTNGTIKSVTKR
jgi:hypothetical protein